MRPPYIVGIIILVTFFHWQIFADEVFQTTPKDAFLKTIYTTKDGLPQNSPTMILQTQDGYIWRATFGGLGRFDGLKFTVFTSSNTLNLMNSRIISLYEDRNRILWIGSEDGDLMNYRNGVFNLVKKSEGTPIDSTIASIYVAQNDVVWIASSDKLRTYDIKTNQFAHYSPDKMLKKRFLFPRRLRQEEFARKLINSSEAERHRIAGELNDGLGQNLLVIRNWTLLLLKQLPVNSKYRKQLEEISEVAALSLKETRNLRPQHLHRFGLTETINNMVKQVEESLGQKFEIKIDDIDNLFSSEEELSVYRIVNESLNNVVKHSGAKNIKVVISKIPGNLEFTNSQDKLMIIISDDGIGFDVQANQEKSFGLDSINQRVRLMGGKYSIKSEIGKGTKIISHLNMKERKNEK